MDHTKNLFESAAIPADFLNNPVLKSTQENLTKLMQGSVFGNVEGCTVPFVDKTKIEKSLKLPSTAITANSYVMSDSISLMASLVQEGYESIINQSQALAKCSDINQLVDAQQAYAHSLHEKIIERTTTNTKLMAGVLETNAAIAKGALEHK